jgi:hypothetical protein
VSKSAKVVLGLGKYEALFHENDIDETVLPNLTAEDLKELGVASLGHRRKLLDEESRSTPPGSNYPSIDLDRVATHNRRSRAVWIHIGGRRRNTKGGPTVKRGGQPANQFSLK